MSILLSCSENKQCLILFVSEAGAGGAGDAAAEA
jgi:hypothetical protein